MSDKLRAFFEQTEPKKWAGMSKEEQDELVGFFVQNPQEFEQLLYDTAPDYTYAMEARQPGSVKQLAAGIVSEGALEGAAKAVWNMPWEAAKTVSGWGVPLGITQPYRALQETAAYNAPQVSGDAATLASGLQSAAQNIGTVLAAGLAVPAVVSNPVTAAAAIPIVATGLMGLQAGGEAAAQHMQPTARENSFDPFAPLPAGIATGVDINRPDAERSSIAALAKGVLSGIAETFFEQYSLGGIFSPGAVKGLATGLLEAGKMAAREIPSELATEAANYLLDKGFGTGSDQPFMERMGETLKTTAISAPISGAGASIVSQATTGNMIARFEQDVNARLNAESVEKQSMIDTAIAEGAAEYLDENDRSVANSVKVQPTEIKAVEGETETMYAASNEKSPDNTDPADYEILTEADDLVQTSEGNPVYGPGDTVFIKARLATEGLPESESIGDRTGQAVVGKVVDVGEDGFLQVELEDGQTATFSPDQLMSQSAMGMRGVSTIVDPDAPTTSQVYRVSRKFFKAFGDSPIFKAITNKMQYAFITYNKQNGRPMKIGYDWALQRFPGQAQKAMTHEIGHFIDMISNESRLESFGLKRPAVDSFLGKLAREYNSAREWILKEPLIDKPEYKELIDKHNKFYEDMKLDYANKGKTFDKRAQSAIQRNWESLMADYGFEALNTDEAIQVTDLANADVQRAIKDQNIPRSERKAFRDKEFMGARKVRVIEAYNKKGMFYLPALRSELEAVSAAVRGLPSRALVREVHGKNATAEMYADFFTAKALGLKAKIDGQYVHLADTVAPNLSQAFDSYMKLNPVAQDVMSELLEPTTDADKLLLDMIQELKKQNDLDLAQRIEQEREPAELVGTGIWEAFKWKFLYKGMGGLINDNIPALKKIDQKQIYKLTNELEKLNGLSSIYEQFIRDVSDVFNPVLERLANDAKIALPLEFLGTAAMENRIRQGGRMKNIVYKVQDGFGNPLTIKTSFDLLSGQSSAERAEAERIWNESTLLAPHIKALSEAFDAFENIWNDKLITRLEQQGVISKETAAAFRAQGGYVTYAAFKSIENSPSFKGVVPQIKMQRGAGAAYRDPIGATMEYGGKILFISQLNEAKRTLVKALPDELKKQVKPVNKVFPEPTSKHYSLVAFRDGGQEFGYHVPSALTQGIDLGKKAVNREFMGYIAEGSAFFRRLLTTWQPAFLPRNMVRDFQRLYINTTNPDTGMPAPSILLHFGKALADTVWGPGKSAEYFKDETRALREGSMILSDADFSMRDASPEGVLKHLERKYTEEARQKISDATKEKREYVQLFNAVVQNPIYKVITGSMGVNPWALESANKKLERVSKRAAYRYYKPFLDKRRITKDQFEILVRHAGSPYFLNKGAWHPFLGSVFMFFNPAMQSLYEDMSAMLERPGTAFNRFMVLSMNYAITDAAISWMVGYAGGAGDEWKDIYSKIPWVSRKNNTCIPLMETPSGKVVYMEIPLDETTAAFKRMAWTIFDSQKNDIFGLAKAVSSPSELAPLSFNPLLKVLSDAVAIAGGNNPWNPFRQRQEFGETEFEAKGSILAKEVLKYFYNTLSPTTPIYKFTYEDLGSKSKIEPKDELEWVAKKLETGMGLPFAQGMIKSGMIKISDQGIHDQLKHMTEEDRQFSATLSVLRKQLVGAVVSEDEAEINEIMETVRKMEPTTAGQAMTMARWDDALRIQLKRAGWETLDPKLKKLLYLSKSERATVLEKGGL